MSSIRRILASRANGAKSRGPKTPEGKLVSSRNAVTHGLTARDVVLGTESENAFGALHRTLIECFQPANEFEAALVKEMAVAKWRQGRLWSIETAAIDFEMDRQRKEIDKKFAGIDNATRTALAFMGLEERSRSMSLFMRYETRMRSAFKHAFELLGPAPDPSPDHSKESAQNEPNPISGHPDSTATGAEGP